MIIKEITKDKKYLKEYAKYCYLQWSSKGMNIDDYIDYKVKKLLEGENVIFIMGLFENDILVGFISLLEKDGEERCDLSPWYATMFVKKEYRKKGYSKLLNNALLEKAKNLNYKRVYLKSDLINYYEKFGFIFIEKLKYENLYYIDL